MNKEISAEMFLELMYPEFVENWRVTSQGTFYRNYNGDVMAVDPVAGEISLARDGFLHLLPDGVYASKDDFNGRPGYMARHEEMKRRMEILNEVFSPFDTFSFRQRLLVERQTSEVLNNKLELILELYFGIKMEKCTDPYVKEALVLLPFVSRFRGDVHFVKMLLAAITGCTVNLDLSHRYSCVDSTKAWLPMAIYTVVKPGLDSSTYADYLHSLEPLCDFIKEWLMPFDIKFRMEVKDEAPALRSGKDFILDYNIELS